MDYQNLYNEYVNSTEYKLIDVIEKEINGLRCKIEHFNYQYRNQWFFFINDIIVGEAKEHAESFSIFGEEW